MRIVQIPKCVLAAVGNFTEDSSVCDEKRLQQIEGVGDVRSEEIQGTGYENHGKNSVGKGTVIAQS